MKEMQVCKFYLYGTYKGIILLTDSDTTFDNNLMVWIIKTDLKGVKWLAIQFHSLAIWSGSFHLFFRQMETEAGQENGIHCTSDEVTILLFAGLPLPTIFLFYLYHFF